MCEMEFNSFVSPYAIIIRESRNAAVGIGAKILVGTHVPTVLLDRVSNSLRIAN